jgi:SAM-dependent methyltransferase
LNRLDHVDDVFARWLALAEQRYLAELTRPELGRALRALSACYVERRGKLASGHALESRGKRAAFALYYAPLHFLTVREIARRLDGASGASGALVVDVGCGTGAAGAAWALTTSAKVRGSDVSPWAVAEAGWTYRTLGVRGTTSRGSVSSLRLPSRPSTLLAAFVVNELPPQDRAVALERLVDAARKGHQVVVVEPIAKKLTPWWGEWERGFRPVGGRTQEWRFRVELPRLLRDLDKSAGLDHRELTARTLWAGHRPLPQDLLT